MRAALGHPETLTRALGYPHAQPHPNTGHRGHALLRQFLYAQGEAKARFHQIIEIPTAGEVEPLTAIQNDLARLIAHWQTPIEVNPSSNQLVSGFRHPLEQPIFRLREIHDTEARSLPITLSADDATTFATSLADEYAYAWAGIVVGADASAGHARAWLEDGAAASWRGRFTLPVVERPETLRFG